MSWRDQLQPGSFRGAPFLIRTADTAVGRRIALHQYPLRDVPWAEDLGRLARAFTVECFVLGPDYMAARDQLVAAIEAEGPGTLIHPYFGTRQVVVAQPANISETTAEGGMATFRIPCAEAGIQQEPDATTDTAGALTGAAGATQAVLADSFASQWAAEGEPEWVANDGMSDIQSLIQTLQAAAASITAIPDALLAWLNQAAQFGSALSQLISAPANLGTELGLLIGSLGPIAAQPIAALSLYGNLTAWQPPPLALTPPSPTPERLQYQTNRAALTALVQGGAVTGGATAIATVPAQTTDDGITGFDDLDTALAARAEFTAAIAAQQLTAAPETYAALADLRVALVRDIATRAATLPALTTFTLAQPMPALVIAERLYADPTRDADIIARNALAYPGFAAGTLQVLNG